MASECTMRTISIEDPRSALALMVVQYNGELIDGRGAGAVANFWKAAEIYYKSFTAYFL